jgi:diguanylate cyclase (GGDEF)-like protein
VQVQVETRHERAKAAARWFTALGAVAFLQACCSILWPAQGLVTCLGVSGGIAVLLCFSIRTAVAADGLKQFKWSLLSFSFVLWIAGFAIILYGEYRLGSYPPGAWVDNLVFAYRWLPLLLALCRPEPGDEPLSFSWLDLFQVLLVGAQLTILMLPEISGHPQGRWAPVSPVQSEVCLNALGLLVLVVAFVRLRAIKRTESQPFYLAVGAMLLTYAWNRPLISLVLIGTWHCPDGSPWFLIGQLPAIAFLSTFFYARIHTVPWFVRAYRDSIAKTLRLASPVFFALACILSGITTAVAGHHIVVGVGSAALGLALYAYRSTLVQLRLMQYQESLTRSNLELETISQRDPLTGTYNRRWFADTLEKEWKRSRRSGKPISLLLIDIDYFKRLNDTLGHVAGDDCLIVVVEALQSQLSRASDSLARYGGEEFVVILPDTNREGAEVVAERLRSAVESLAMANPDTPSGRLTISLGGAAQTQPGSLDTPDMLILMADAALYEAKRLGRNRVHIVSYDGTAVVSNQGVLETALQS